MAEPTTRLAVGQGDPDRPFTDPAHAEHDLALLARIHAAVAARIAAGGEEERWTDADGGRHWLVVPDRDCLRATAPAVGVGFFGQALDVDHDPINRIEAEMLQHVGRYPGLLGYCNVEYPQPDGTSQWGNLVVFADRAAADALNAEGLHRSAVERSPRHYASLRLHRVELPEGAAGSSPPRLVESLLFDFADDPVWVGLRAA